MRNFLLAVVVTGLVLSSCGGGSDKPGFLERNLEESERWEHNEKLVVREGRAVIGQYASRPDEWLVHATCHLHDQCSAQLRYAGYPLGPVAAEGYEVKGGRVVRVSPERFKLALTVDAERGCTDIYLESEDPESLINCELEGVEERQAGE